MALIDIYRYTISDHSMERGNEWMPWAVNELWLAHSLIWFFSNVIKKLSGVHHTFFITEHRFQFEIHGTDTTKLRSWILQSKPKPGNIRVQWINLKCQKNNSQCTRNSLHVDSIKAIQLSLKILVRPIPGEWKIKTKMKLKNGKAWRGLSEDSANSEMYTCRIHLTLGHLEQRQETTLWFHGHYDQQASNFKAS